MVSSKVVAKLAGVSQSTVSRVLNGSPHVRKDKVEKVMKAMKELNFRPNQIARSLVKNKTNTIALISGHLQNPYFVETTTKIVDIAVKHGYNILVYFENQGDIMSIYQAVLGQQVEGIILSSIFLEDPVYYELEQSGIPFVMFNRRHRLGGNFVELDNYKATSIATSYLVNLGHDRIAYIGGPINTSTFLERQNGYVDTLKNNNIQVDSNLIRVTNTAENEVREATKDIMEMLNKRPTAILAATDSMALNCINELIKLGVSVQDDVSVCGIDNIQLASQESVQLTTVGNVSERSMGEIAIEQLIQVIENKDTPLEPMQLTLEPKLIVRKTTTSHNSSLVT
jgi:LacI family transcriptional regulator